MSGSTRPTQSHARHGWLLPYVECADCYVFSRRAYAWDCLDERRTRVVAPSIDPFSTKNCMLDARAVDEILSAAGILRTVAGDAEYVKTDGQVARVEHTAVMLEVRAARSRHSAGRADLTMGPPQGPAGSHGRFREWRPSPLRRATPACRAQCAGVDDDPEGAEVYAEVARSWQLLAPHARRLVHLACLPMYDEQENAMIVNALQRRASIIVQKSLAEGFGLTVAEAMWKSRPVVASEVGGIRDQIEEGISGVLLHDPRDPTEFGTAVCALLEDEALCARLGSAAHARVEQAFLGARHLGQYVDICADLLRDRDCSA